jgi:hypothetical protein
VAAVAVKEEAVVAEEVAAAGALPCTPNIL